MTTLAVNPPPPAHPARTIVNPLAVEGQIQGGIAQGVGQALFERVQFDAGGQLLSSSLGDHALPRELRTCRKQSSTAPSRPARFTLLGAKAVGEAGAIPPAVVNAVLDALASLGIRHLDLPFTAERVRKAMLETKVSADEQARCS